jgi:hypothetical protein
MLFVITVHHQAKLVHAQQGRKQKLHASSELLGSLRASRQQRSREDRDQDCSRPLRESDAGSNDLAAPDVADVGHEMVEQVSVIV